MRSGSKVRDAKAALNSDDARRLFLYRDGSLIRRVRRGAALAGSVAGSVKRDGYLQVNVAGRHIPVHRVIWLLHHDNLPVAIDHINGIRSDNRIENLRAASPGENACNVRAVWGNTPFKGVTRLPSGRYQVQISKDSKAQYLGVFDRPEDAARTYDAAAARLFGEFACTNAAMGLL